MISLPYRVWGKTETDSNQSSEDRSIYHPLICHLIDVAHLAGELWEQYLASSVRRWTETDLDLDSNQSAAWIRFLAGMHDIGKCTPEFQRKSATFSQPLRDAGLHLFTDSGVATPHGLAGAVIFKRMLESRWQMPRRQAATVWAQVIGGHHGEFSHLKPLLHGPVYGDQPWFDLREKLVNLLAGHCNLTSVPVKKPATRTALLLAGLISTADWLASNQDFFPCAAVLGQTADFDLSMYRETAKSQARRALQETGWRTLLALQDNSPFHVLFPDMSPRPSQARVDALTNRLQSPAILILEAPTGEGKTEAALQVSDRLAQAAGQRGFYFALPTQATSNQMFRRIRQFLEQRFAGEPALPLYLLHAHAALSQEMLDLLHSGQLIAHLASIGEDPGRDGLFAAEWFTKPKRGLLSPFAVGTVDQALLAALITRHVFVRLFGLAGKVIVIDEVHAYDTYMSTLLERMLEWMGALHSAVILLSATLPRTRRHRLLKAWTRGAGLPSPPLDDTPYPRLSMAALDGSVQYASLPVSGRSHRAVALTWSPGSDFARDLLRRIAHGGCAAIVCNTVRSAQETFRTLKQLCDALPDPERPALFLFHARFPFEDRQRTEKLVLELFGPGEDKRPKRALLVATQVIEQSLDLDFDLLGSELAPVDLLLQRAGRLHRHGRARPQALSAPELILFEPELRPDGLPEFSRADRFVYDHYVLLQTWRVLKKTHQIQTPEDTESLIETVYSEDPADWGTDALGDRLSVCYQALQKSRQDEQNEASNRYIPSPGAADLTEFTSNPLDEDNPAQHPRLQALTRLAEPSVTCICLFGDWDHAYLDAAHTKPVFLNKKPDAKLTKVLLNRSLTVADKRLLPILCSDIDIPSAWSKNIILRTVRPIFLDIEFQARIGAISLRCDPEFGLQVLADEQP